MPEDAILGLIERLGTAGILGLSLYMVARVMGPVVKGWADAQRELAAARQNQADASKAVLKRWEDSDKAMESNRHEHVQALNLVATRLEKLDITDTQRIRQNDLIHGVVNGIKAEVAQLPRIFEVGKNDAVDKVKQAMEDKINPIEIRLETIERLLHEVRDLVNRQLPAPSASPPPAADPPAPTESKGAPDARPE